MKRMHVHINVDELAPAIDFYRAMLGAEPVLSDPKRAMWRLETPRLDLTIAANGREPGLDRLGIEAENDDDLVVIHRRLGAANLAIVNAGAASGPTRPASTRAIDPTGMVWDGHLEHGAVGADGAVSTLGQRDATPLPAGVMRPFGDFAPSEDPSRVLTILFLCTGNSARSIMAEAIMNRLGRERFRGLSAGSMPKGTIHPGALDLLERMNHITAPLRSKSWEEYAGLDGPKLDFVFTLCDNAASEVCPIWPGQPMSAHWGLPDPAETTGNAATMALAFADTYRMLEQRIGIFVNLPIASLDRLSLQRRLDRIGRTTAASA